VDRVVSALAERLSVLGGIGSEALKAALVARS
jgi:hypothetical protein